MKKLQIIIIIAIVFLSVICYSLLRPSVWQNQITNYIHENLFYENDWKIKLGKLEGNLLTQIKGEGTELHHPEGFVMVINHWDLKLNIWNSIIHIPTAEFIKINNLEITIDNQKYISKDSLNLSSSIIPSNFPEIFIRTFTIDGNVIIKDKIESIQFSSNGSARSSNDLLILEMKNTQITDSFYFKDFQFEQCRMTSDAKKKTAVFESSGMWNESTIQYDFLLNEKDNGFMESRLEFRNLNVENYFPDFPEINQNYNSLNGEIHINSDQGKTVSNFIIWNSVEDTIPGEFELNFRSNSISITNAKMTKDSTSLHFNFLVNPQGNMNGWCKINQLKLTEWLNYPTKIILDGDIYFSGFLEDNKVKEWTFSADVIEKGIFPNDTLALSLSGLYDGEIFEFSEPLNAILNDQIVLIENRVNLISHQIYVNMNLKDVQLGSLPFSEEDFAIDGVMSGHIDINGTPEKPEFELNLLVENLKGYLFTSSQTEVKGHIHDVMAYGDGDIRLTFKNGRWSEVELGDGEIDITFNNGDIQFKDISFTSGDNFLQGSGKMEKSGKISMEQLQMGYESHYVAIPQPLIAIHKDEEIFIKPFIVHVNDGMIEGVVHLGSTIDGTLKMSNLDGAFINDFVPENRMNLSGLIFGEIGFSQTGNKQSSTIDLTVKRGQFYNQKFDDLTLSAIANEDLIHIEDFTLTHKNRTGLNLFGQFPLNKKSSENLLHIDSHFSFLAMEFFTQFIPDPFPLTGFASGEIKISGGNSPEYNFDIEIDESFYDKIYLGKLTGRGEYQDKNLWVSEFNSQTSNGNIMGSARLPLDLDYQSEQSGKGSLHAPLDVNLSGQFSHMDFLTNYVSMADSVRGNVEIDLSISGYWDNLVRDGKIELENCNIYSVSLDNPITQIDGTGMLNQNILQFDELKGIKSQSKEKIDPNIFVRGNLDLHQFFIPYYNLNITGDDIAFNSLTDEMEGNVSLNLNISGRDTVSINGLVGINDFTLFKEFNTTSLQGKQSTKKEEKLIHYDINFPIKESISLINSQIDAKLNGQLHYTRWGNNPADYSGELFFTEGKFYYYSEVFIISEGFLSFTQKGFNPILNIMAITDIEDEEIQVSFTGPLDQPTLMLSSESGFSQSDILELLTWGKRFEDQTISYTGLGNQAAEKLEKWLDSQFDRKIMEISGLDRLNILEEVQIEGATGLFNPKNAESFSIKAGLTKKVSLKYAYHRSFSLTNPNHSVGIEYKVNRYLSLVGNVDENGQVHAKYRLRYSY
jgi:hypothetical protein